PGGDQSADRMVNRGSWSAIFLFMLGERSAVAKLSALPDRQQRLGIRGWGDLGSSLLTQGANVD
ncbi:MAG: hypothetical protein WCH12_06460, partial [Candidatus Nitrotoga sp.]